MDYHLYHLNNVLRMEKKVKDYPASLELMGKEYEAPKCEIIELNTEYGMMLTGSQQGNPGFGSYSSDYDW